MKPFKKLLLAGVIALSLLAVGGISVNADISPQVYKPYKTRFHTPEHNQVHIRPKGRLWSYENASLTKRNDLMLNDNDGQYVQYFAWYGRTHIAKTEVGWYDLKQVYVDGNESDLNYYYNVFLKKHQPQLKPSKAIRDKYYVIFVDGSKAYIKAKANIAEHKSKDLHSKIVKRFRKGQRIPVYNVEHSKHGWFFESGKGYITAQKKYVYFNYKSVSPYPNI